MEVLLNFFLFPSELMTQWGVLLDFSVTWWKYEMKFEKPACVISSVSFSILKHSDKFSFYQSHRTLHSEGYRDILQIFSRHMNDQNLQYWLKCTKCTSEVMIQIFRLLCCRNCIITEMKALVIWHLLLSTFSRSTSCWFLSYLTIWYKIIKVVRNT